MRLLSLTRITALLILSVLVLGIANLPPVYGGEDPGKAEVKMGREAAVDVEKEKKLITDPAVTERVERIGKAIAEVANLDVVPATYGNSEIYKFDYKFKVIEDESVNAFSLPGGIIYVHKGLLDYVQSDHELAGVLAHEIAHSAHHHMTYLLKEQSKLDGQIALVLIAGMLTKVNSRDLGHLLIGAQLVRIARASGYGQKAEADADVVAVAYMAKAGYNPVGSLTFMERLAHDYAASPSLDLGIMQTHPAPADRCKCVTAQIKALGLPINRRAVTDSLKAVTEQTVVGDKTIVQVKLGDKVIFEAAPIESSDGMTILARGVPFMIVTPQVGDLLGKYATEVASQAASLVSRAIWGEMVSRLY
ncbi:MAG: M48 family metalloprotease [Armatimonadetes bacterium]|nr:M48 family metalloprotease [Armatimonadota bacterium]